MNASTWALALAIGCAGGEESGGAEPSAAEPRWRTDGGVLIDPEGRGRLLHGINVSNDVKWPPYESWAEAEDYVRLAGWGYTAVRLLTSWAAIMPEEGVVDEDYLDAYAERVDMAADAGLLVIVDMHQDVFGEGFASGGGDGAPLWACDASRYEDFEPTSPWYLNYLDPDVQACFDHLWTDPGVRARFAEAWAAVAARVADREAVVGFDLFNEPFQGTLDPETHGRERLQPFYAEVMEAIDAVAPGRLYFVEPVTAAELCLDPGLGPFADGEGGVRDDVVYAPHYYHPDVHDGRGYDGDDGPIRTVLDCFEETAAAMEAPLFLGEIGGPSSAEGIEEYVADLMGALDARGVGDTWWEYSPDSGGFSPIDDEGAEKPEILDEHARITPAAWTGVLESHAWDAEAGRLELRWTPGDGPMELAVPWGRVDPESLAVSPASVSATWDGSRLVVEAPAGEPVEITVSTSAR